MKEIFSNAIYFVAFALVFSMLTSCSGTTTSENGAQTGTTNSTTTAGKSSEYPPLNAGIAQADMRHLDDTTSKVADRKGKVLLLNMWATWCGPCRAEMPALVKMQDEHREKGFEIIGLNTDDGDTKEMVEKFAQEMNLNYTLVWAPTDMQDSLLHTSKFDGIPQSFVVDRNGHLRGVFRGANPAEIKKMEDVVAAVVAE